MVSASQCQLPYPDRYAKAFSFYQAWPPAASQPSQETLLLLYALSSQVEHGPCKDPKPSAWQGAAQAKWVAWQGLQDMEATEAMRLFVKTLEEDEPEWYSYCANGSSAVLDPNGKDGASMGLRSLPSDNMWRSPWVVAEKHPHPRFEHSCCLIGSTMYLFGGNAAGGRYLPDMWQLNMETLTWSNVTSAFTDTTPPPEDSSAPRPPPSASFPACAAAVALAHRGRALIIGGHSKAHKGDPNATLQVRILDPARHTWSVLECSGALPTVRGGHAAAAIGDKVYVFGGEGPRLRMQPGVKILDLVSNEWSDMEAPPDAGPAPAPRSAVAATAYQDRYFIIFGGGAVGKCHNDLWVLDTETNLWEQPTLKGPGPTARAGCCSALLGNHWYILGGGNNAAGCPDMWMLDLVQLGYGELEWQLVAHVDARSSLSSEGASLVAAPAYGALVSFGGYNGVFHNAVSVFKPADCMASKGSPMDSKMAEIQPADAELGPEASRAVDYHPVKVGKSTADMLEEVSVAKEALQSELEELRNVLSSTESARADAETMVQAAQEELALEKDRAFKLEVEVSELKSKLQGMHEIELECTKYKQMLAERERKSGGIWGYISGA